MNKICIDIPEKMYGSRTSTVLLIEKDGTISFIEKDLLAMRNKEAVEDVVISFKKDLSV